MRKNLTRVPNFNSKRYKHAREQYAVEIAFWRCAQVSFDWDGRRPTIVVTAADKKVRRYGLANIREPFHRIRVAAVRRELNADLATELKRVRKEARLGIRLGQTAYTELIATREIKRKTAEEQRHDDRVRRFVELATILVAKYVKPAADFSRFVEDATEIGGLIGLLELNKTPSVVSNPQRARLVDALRVAIENISETLRWCNNPEADGLDVPPMYPDWLRKARNALVIVANLLNT
jgi:hypothetical protein